MCNTVHVVTRPPGPASRVRLAARCLAVARAGAGHGAAHNAPRHHTPVSFDTRTLLMLIPWYRIDIQNYGSMLWDQARAGPWTPLIPCLHDLLPSLPTHTGLMEGRVTRKLIAALGTQSVISNLWLLSRDCLYLPDLGWAERDRRKSECLKPSPSLQSELISWVRASTSEVVWILHNGVGQNLESAEN